MLGAGGGWGGGGGGLWDGMVGVVDEVGIVGDDVKLCPKLKASKDYLN